MNADRMNTTRRATIAEAIAALPESGRVFIGANAGEPRALVAALGEVADRFDDLEVVQVLSLGCEALVRPAAAGHIRINALFIGPAVRDAVARGQADYTPVFLSRIPSLIRSRRMPVDVVLVQCTPPDRFGYVNLGVSVDVARAAVQTARRVIAQVNPHMPRTHGDGLVHVSQLANRFVKDPSEIVKVGDRVRVKVVTVDLARKRLGLSIKQVGG